ncbi:hepatic and glial cell adhesion molecule-like isoform X1 [Acipenser ruthenus]|uniref:hepatic and glial cell adhesion molecule-like isoform X1 n=1 Tax=Acipenser ruthenus TaxID=7906 RepID=UPI0027407D73|nr:hepatic and glial cell adhesion molecule-like isoform X1 [Acipenser ruthenus]
MGSSAIGLAVNWVDWKHWFLLFSNRDLNPGSQFLSLLFLPLLLSLLQTASADPSQEDQFYTALNQDAVLTVNFTSNSQCDVFWRKTIKAVNSSVKMVYKHMQNMSKGDFLGPYLTRAHYYSHNNTLVLNNVTEEDEGVYEVTQECGADSTISRRMIRLSLMSPLSEPLITVSVRNTSHSMLLTLSCELTEGTQPSYWWLKDGKPLPQDGRHFVSEQNSSLEVRNATEQDCVTYTCVSQNRLGSREAQRDITANDSPACISPGSAGSLTPAQILSIAAAVLCVAGLCIVVYCTKRHYQEIRTWFRDRWRNPGNSMEQSSLDRGSRRESPYDMPEEELLNEENMQGAASAGDSVKVQYVYMDFLPNRGSSHRQTEEEDNHGYSTINYRDIQEGPDTRELNTDLEEQGESEPWH